MSCIADVPRSRMRQKEEDRTVDMPAVTPAVARAVERAQQRAGCESAAELQPSHLLHGLLAETEGRAADLLCRSGIDADKLPDCLVKP